MHTFVPVEKTQIVREVVIIKIVKYFLLTVYYLTAVYLGFGVISEWIVDIQGYLNGELRFQTWAPTGASYTIMLMTELYLVLAIFGWGHLLIVRKAEAILIIGVSVLALLGLLLTPLAIDHYVAADNDGFYHDPFFGFEPIVYPWEEARVILGYEYYRSRGSPNLGINYIIKTGEKEYDLWKSLKSAPSEEQFQMVKDVNRMIREKGVPITIRRKIGSEELEFMMNNSDFTPGKIELLKDIFEVKEY